ncbi:MAG TPA: M4 family metallopeptidase, partial [Chitinophagales bacterium]|nr:M4 family metallopeptidase [Chitinophagales bacterium]
PVTLWYGNDLPYFTQYPDAKQIRLSSCNFGNCKLHHLKQDNVTHRMEAYANPDDFAPFAPISNTKRYYWWADSGTEMPPSITLNFSVLPTAWEQANGTATLTFTPPSGLDNNYTMTGDLSGTNVSVLSGLSAGMHNVTITHNPTGCTYPQAIAIGTQGGFNVTPTIAPVTCYAFGNIILNMANAAGAEVMMSAPISTPQFNGIVFYPFPAGSNTFNVAEQLNNGNLLPPGNYAILVKKGGEYTALNLRLDYPDCPTELPMLQTAYWAIERVHSFFKNPDSQNCYLTTTPPTAPTPVNLALASPSSGINQFTAANPLIELSLLNSWDLNAATNLSSLASDNKIRIRVSNGNGTQPMVDLDILAHEYAHAINAKGANVECNSLPKESGALVESFCDIMGIMVQSTVKQLDWNIGESVGTLRALNTPKLYNNPTTYGGQYWDAGTALSDDWRYINSHVLSYWFYLLTTGHTGTVDDGFSASYPSATPSRNVPSGTTFNVPAIGAEKAAKILMEVFTISTGQDSWGLNVTTNQNYPGIARATLIIAEQLYGFCSSEALAVREAWRAVGIDAWQTESATCDITKPYIKELKVTNSSGAVKYHKRWQINPVNGKLCLTDVAAAPQSLILQTGGSGQTIQLEVTTNEPLSSLAFSGFRKADGTLVNTGFTQSAIPDDNATIWTINITTNTALSLSGLTTFVFTGYDLAGNELLSMQSIEGANNAPPCLNYNELPQRFSPSSD